MLSNLDLRSTLHTNELCFVKFSCIWPNFTFPGGWVGGAKSRLKTNSAQNRAARIVTRLENRTEIGKLLNQVGWLSVRQLCAYHSILLIFKSQMQVRPVYFVNKLQRRFPYNTRRSYENCFTIDNIPKTEILKKSFFFRSQTLWNQLPSEMKKLTKVEEFKRKLRAWIKEYLPL